eukprot:TRINITY_DN52244_c0_g1_i2.p1 TRINITY_DN52244_c0_g1~~TRINITY_DN52244_c0_g1_i2.p1  ORF type:complete len:184 (-),score=3.56 TRINITY_DN52244_c0_g1_i2:576-1127(-)
MFLDTEYQRLNGAFTSFLNCINDIQRTVSTQHRNFQRIYKTTQDERYGYAPSVHGSEILPVTLNVGGALFKTSTSTLMSTDSFFSAMLRSGEWASDSDGQYFIDRSPIVFPLILHHLRTGERVPTDHLSEFEKQVLGADVDFYQIDTFFPPRSCVRFIEPTEGDDSISVSLSNTRLYRKKPNR